MSKKRILITGGAGFIGSQLGFYLHEQGHEVILLDNLKYGYVDNLVLNGKIFPRFFCMDVRDQKLRSIMEGIDVVFHFAAISSLPECNCYSNEAISVNVGGTANVLELARQCGVSKIVLASTSAIYENETDFPSKESAEPKPTFVYSASKAMAEDLCNSFRLMYSMDITVLRFFNVYGPHMDYLRPNPPLVSYIIKCLLEDAVPLLHSNGEQARDMVYVSDIMRICEIAMTHPKAKNDVFNVGSGTTHSVREVYSIIAQAFGRENIVPIYRESKLIWEKYSALFSGDFPLHFSFLEAEVNKYTLADTSKAKEVLGWTCEVDLAKGLHETVEYAKKNNTLSKKTKVLHKG